jgi:hypothetical protein
MPSYKITGKYAPGMSILAGLCVIGALSCMGAPARTPGVDAGSSTATGGAPAASGGTVGSATGGSIGSGGADSGGSGGATGGSGGASSGGSGGGATGGSGGATVDAGTVAVDAGTAPPTAPPGSSDGGAGGGNPNNPCFTKAIGNDRSLPGLSAADFCDGYEAYCEYTADGSKMSMCGTGQPVGPLYKDRADCEAKYMAASAGARACRAGQMCRNGKDGKAQNSAKLIVNACSHATGYCAGACK